MSEEITVRAQLADVAVFVQCVCGSPETHEIECFPDGGGDWEVRVEDGFILCDECGALIDATMILRRLPK